MVQFSLSNYQVFFFFTWLLDKLQSSFTNIAAVHAGNCSPATDITISLKLYTKIAVIIIKSTYLKLFAE